mgnify:CR=1 FL=1
MPGVWADHYRQGMDLHVLVTTAGPEQPPPGLPVVVEVRDTSRLDVASTTVSSARSVTGQVADQHTFPEDPLDHQPVASVQLSVPDDVPDPDSLTVWARVAAEDHDHVSAGDWITVQAYPVHSDIVVVDVVPV